MFRIMTQIYLYMLLFFPQIIERHIQVITRNTTRSKTLIIMHRKIAQNTNNKYNK